MALGARIRERRKEFQLTQQQLAELIGARQSSISSLERKDAIKSEYDFELARVLGVTVEWLRTGRLPKFATDAEAVGDVGQAEYGAPPSRNDLLIRQRLLIEKILTLSHASLDQIEPLIDSLDRLQAIERTKKSR